MALAHLAFVACGEGNNGVVNEQGAASGGNDSQSSSTGGDYPATGGQQTGGSILGPSGGRSGSGGRSEAGGAPTDGMAGSPGEAPSSSGGEAGSLAGGGRSCLDVFGRTMLYETAPAGLRWDSGYWYDDAHSLAFKEPDPSDSLLLANRRGTGEVTINGDGSLNMTGSQPRLYLGTSERHPWKNVEVTIYYRRVEDDATPWGGLVVGARSGPDGHGDEPCSATTYYARMRHDGMLDLAKELMHPEALARASVQSYNGHELPFNVWIGMKFIVTNSPSGAVRLQVLRDRREAEDGGYWEPLLDEFDQGGWAPPHECSYEDDHVILEGGGVVLIRNTGLEGAGADYKDLTVREVDPNAPCKP